MSATRLLVLGVVRMYGRAHGYQVRRELLTWSADKWANVAPGSIYHALKKMTREKLLEEVPTEDGEGDTRGPDRTAYQLTPDGETEFQVLLAKGLSESDESPQNFYRLVAAIPFLPVLPRARAISLLQHQLTQLRGRRANAQDMLDRDMSWGEPAHVAELYRLWVTMIDGMLSWVEGLVSRLETGEYVLADDPGTAFGEPGSAH
ncbi:PadR family transcriptional regulator [Actinophytocola sp.]|uniref:PadR family transcriptional regulator n=1 Tax=Actinophytocola sp. TaxID=1872138 RepID=UPI003D6C5F51